MQARSTIAGGQQQQPSALPRGYVQPNAPLQNDPKGKEFGPLMKASIADHNAKVDKMKISSTNPSQIDANAAVEKFASTNTPHPENTGMKK